MEIKTKTEATPELERFLPTDHGAHLDPIAVTDTGGSYTEHMLTWGHSFRGVSLQSLESIVWT